MTYKQFLFFLLAILLCFNMFAQKDTIFELKEVKITDWQLKNNSKTQSVQILSDTLLNREASLTSLLQNHTPLYFKENGFGMVASPSFRGTTAQQTAVIWNGININSPFNGQTDFNGVSYSGFDAVTVKAGGGSAVYGSGAIGGTIHLNNSLEFKKKSNTKIQLNYGSFETFRGTANIEQSSEKWSFRFNAVRVQSKNNYPYIGYSLKNENAAFWNHQLSTAIGYQHNKFNTLSYYGQYYENDRQFSGTLAVDSKSKYKTLTARNLLDWTYHAQHWISKVKFAHLYENFQYFEDQTAKETSFGSIQSTIVRYDGSYPIDKKINFNFITDYNFTSGWTTDMNFNSRQISASTLLLKHQLNPKLLYNISLRKEISTAYKSPLLYGVGLYYEINKHHTLRGNGSRNFRMPTFNDLYWPGSGNLNLKPESAFLGEFGYDLKLNNFNWKTTIYASKIQDMIQWIPESNGNWKPQNAAKVSVLGIETGGDVTFKWKAHQLKGAATYSYTQSQDATTSQQLVYVPFHKSTFNVSYYFKKWSAYYTYRYNGKVYTSTDNAYSLKAYQLSDIGVYRQFGNNYQSELGFQISNLFNEAYQNVALRPMPGQNYNIIYTLKF